MKIRRTVSILIISVIVAIAAASIFIVHTRKPETDAAPNNPPLRELQLDASHRNTLAEHWNRKQSVTAASETGTPNPQDEELTSFGFSVSAIYEAIGSIEIKDDDLVIDKNTKNLLNQAVSQFGIGLTDAELAEVEAILFESLPEPLGKRASGIFQDFYAYKRAEIQQNQQPLNLTNEEQLERIINLRRQYLGDELANIFYGDEEAVTRLFIESRRIHENKNLSAEQKTAQGKSLAADLASGYLHIDSPDNENIIALKREIGALNKQGASAEFVSEVQDLGITIIAAQQAIADPEQQSDFQQRAQQFSQGREYILNAGLVEDDKLQQLKSLARKYFSDEELKKAAYYRPAK